MSIPDRGEVEEIVINPFASTVAPKPVGRVEVSIEYKMAGTSVIGTKLGGVVGVGKTVGVGETVGVGVIKACVHDSCTVVPAPETKVIVEVPGSTQVGPRVVITSVADGKNVLALDTFLDVALAEASPASLTTIPARQTARNPAVKRRLLVNIALRIN